jgi:hypothetical protein
VAVCDAAFGEIVRGQFDIDPIAHQYADPIPTHSARDRREYHMVGIIDLHLEVSIRLFVDYDSGHFYKFFFHKYLSIQSQRPTGDREHTIKTKDSVLFTLSELLERRKKGLQQ